MANITMQVPNFGKFSAEVKARRKEFYAAAMTAVVRDMIKGIQDRKAITGGAFPALEPETVALKGHDRPLIDKGLLTDEFTYQQVNKFLIDTAEITIKPRTRTITKGNKKKGIAKVEDTPRDQVGVELQINGIDSKHGKKFFRFFGISMDASQEIMTLADTIVQESLEKI